jgi:predicted transcriptional regulator
MTSAKRSKRGKFEIYGDIVEAVDGEIQQHGTAQLTRIQLRSNQPYDRFKDDLLTLQSKGLVMVVEQSIEPSSVTLTDAGKEYLAHYRRVRKFLEDYGL